MPYIKAVLRRRARSRVLSAFTSTFTFILLAVLSVAVSGCAKHEPPINVSINARSAVILDSGTGAVLFEKEPDVRLQPASTVKLMTAVVAVERLPLDYRVAPTASVASVEPTNIQLKPGVSYRLKDLVEAILIKSANDAAVAIAEGVSGSEEKFVELMNRKAKKLGMENTNFTGASGLPSDPREDQYTTARDLARLMRYALRHETIIDAMSQTESDIYGSDNRRIHLNTHNKSLFSPEGMAWGKTGYTKKARRTFVGSDPSYEPRIVFALMKSNDLWNDIAELKNRGLEIYERKRKRGVLGRVISWMRGGV